MTEKNFRLPTEAEWEFAARGGNRNQGHIFSGDDVLDEVAWYKNNTVKEDKSDPDYGTHPVGQKAPNELGLYDMSGNVFEWCSDWYENYSPASQINPSGPASGTKRVRRGGCWSAPAWYCRVSRRESETPDFGIDDSNPYSRLTKYLPDDKAKELLSFAGFRLAM